MSQAEVSVGGVVGEGSCIAIVFLSLGYSGMLSGGSKQRTACGATTTGGEDVDMTAVMGSSTRRGGDTGEGNEAVGKEVDDWVVTVRSG